MVLVILISLCPLWELITCYAGDSGHDAQVSLSGVPRVKVYTFRILCTYIQHTCNDLGLPSRWLKSTRCDVASASHFGLSQQLWSQLALSAKNERFAVTSLMTVRDPDPPTKRSCAYENPSILMAASPFLVFSCPPPTEAETISHAGDGRPDRLEKCKVEPIGQ